LTQIEFLTILQTALTLILELAGPVLFASMSVGLVISLFQSVTQIQEATLTFVPKIIAGLLTLMFMAPWMLDIYLKAVNDIFAQLSNNIR
jgi:flagellar biosynthetic protein FliQ